MSLSTAEELELVKRKLAETYKLAALGRLLAMVAHEINTPMGCIASNNEILQRSIPLLQRILTEARDSSSPPPQKVLDVLSTLANLTEVDKVACERMAAIVRSVRSISRTDDRELRRVNVHDFLEDSLKLAGALFRSRIVVDRKYGELPDVECYPYLLGQVFLNLLVNAGQAISGEGRVTVETRREDNQVHIAISDTGKGIRPEDRHRIFEFGFTTKSAEEGTGLGLNISRDIIVAIHGGAIDFESQPGAGTTFHVRIPIDQARNNAN
jgi:signal transduction histidine kinase